MELATVNGSAITGFKNGLLQTGYFADFMVCDATHPCMLPLENALSHFVYSLSPQAIRKVAVGGEFVVERG
jgi:cytosine/adenosine deaminase-related metal-dependent hydrolase